ncbi:MAG: ketopantoate reductase family protein [Spirochaetota bacterium]
MKVIVAGCGALGSIYAAGLIKSGAEVQVYQRRGATFDAIRRQGGVKIVRSEGKRAEFHPIKRISDKADELEPADLIVVLVKAYSTKELKPLSACIRAEGVALTLQNGLGNAEGLAEIFGEERIAAGVATYGAFTESPGTVQAAGSGLVSLGPWQPGQDMQWVADVLRKEGFNTDYVGDPRPYIWRKLAINAMVNTTAALTRARNGLLRENQHVLGLMRSLGEETVEAARRAGVKVGFEDLWDFHMENLQKTGSNRASMLQDVEAGRQTEIGAISGAVLDFARDEDDFPYTRAVYSLIKGIDGMRQMDGS